MQGCIFFTTWLFEKLLWLFLPKFFLTSSFPLFFSFWCCVEFWTRLYQFAGLCQGCIFDNLMFWIFGLKVFPLLFITGCNVFLQVLLLDTFLQWALCFFPLFWENFACLWRFSPIFHSVFCYEFSLWVQLGCYLSKCTGVYFTTNCFGTLLWTFFPSFPSQAVECYFIKY